jgi:hypothetical protein
MTPIENATLDFWCAAFARRRDLPMTDLLRGGFDDGSDRPDHECADRNAS